LPLLRATRAGCRVERSTCAAVCGEPSDAAGHREINIRLKGRAAYFKPANGSLGDRVDEPCDLPVITELLSQVLQSKDWVLSVLGGKNNAPSPEQTIYVCFVLPTIVRSRWPPTMANTIAPLRRRAGLQLGRQRTAQA